MHSVLQYKRATAALMIWTVGVITGTVLLMRYGTSPGVAQAPPAHWPEASKLELSPNRPSLVTFLHPHCPCSRATLSELTTLLKQCGESVDCTLVFIQPPGALKEWVRGDLWKSAGSIPHTSVVVDHGGSMADTFNAETSGYTLLYNSRGELLFSGGITSSRGQIGANAGSKSLLQLIRRTSSMSSSAPVYGCPLFTPLDSTKDPNASFGNCCEIASKANE